jgi:hypothetical protein
MEKSKIVEIKEMLKSEAKGLRDTKAEIKNGMRDGKYVGSLQSKLASTKYHWRHKHIAYCLLKGRTIEEIESHCSDDNLRNDALVEKYKKEFCDE